jgi:hypothetical protein
MLIVSLNLDRAFLKASLGHSSYWFTTLSPLNTKLLLISFSSPNRRMLSPLLVLWSRFILGPVSSGARAK